MKSDNLVSSKSHNNPLTHAAPYTGLVKASLNWWETHSTESYVGSAAVETDKQEDEVIDIKQRSGLQTLS